MNISVTLTPEIRMRKALKQEGVKDTDQVTRLTIAGTITDNDFKYIRENMAKKLQILDMSGASLNNNRIALYECTGLASVTIPKSVTTIEERAFYYCTVLTDIIVHPDNPAYTSENGVLFNKDKTELIVYPAGRNEVHYDIPNSVTKIRGGAFQCAGLTLVFISDSVKTIEYNAFSCTGLQSVTIPDWVTEIEGYTFFECNSLTSVFMPDTITKIGTHAFDTNGFSSISILASVTEIEVGAFYHCHHLSSIILPASVTKISAWAFSYCGLTPILLSGSIWDAKIDEPPEYITVNPDNPVYESINGKLRRKQKTEKELFEIIAPAKNVDEKHISAKGFKKTKKIISIVEETKKFVSLRSRKKRK